jgi:molecular chaperone DnaK
VARVLLQISLGVGVQQRGEGFGWLARVAGVPGAGAGAGGSAGLVSLSRCARGRARHRPRRRVHFRPGPRVSALIERNTTIPTKHPGIFTTAEDNQQSVQIQVFQGEREIAAYNKKLGMFELAGLACAKRGSVTAIRGIAPLAAGKKRGGPQIEVAFDIDANGIVNVSAKDLGTGKQQSVQITGGSALAKDDIEKMVRDAEQYAEEDRKRREEAEVRNQADSLVYQTEKFLGENEDKVPEDVKSEVRESLAEAKKALESNDTEAIKSATERAAQVSQKMGTAIYQQAQAAQAQAQQSGSADGSTETPADDEVVEEEIVDDGGHRRYRDRRLRQRGPCHCTGGSWLRAVGGTT